MGCGASSPNDGGPTYTSAASAPNGAKVEMFSAESHGFANVKLGGELYAKKISGNKTSSDHSICKGFDIANAPGKQTSIRWWKTDTFPEGISDGKLQSTLSGDVDLTDASSLGAVFGSYLPIQAPVAKVTLDNKLGGNALIFPEVTAVDMYVTVDGEAKTDGHICCGDVSLDRSAAIEHAVKKCQSNKKMLSDGPSSGGKPWATLVSDAFKKKAFIHLPLIFAGSVDDCALPESESYAGPLLANFSKLLSELGAGKHEWQIRLVPRGIIDGPDNMDARGGFKGGGDQGIGVSADSMYAGDANFKALIDGPLAGQHEAADVPGLTAKFTLTCGENMCKGGGGERSAPAYKGAFSDTLAEHCTIAFGLCDKGPCNTAVRGMTKGKPAHIVPSEGLGNMNSQNGREAGKRFTANAFFYSADPSDPEGIGAMCNFVSAYYERKNGAPVGNPKWESEGVAGNSRDKCYAFPIKNGKIDEAIARDAGSWTASSAGAASNAGAADENDDDDEDVEVDENEDEDDE